MKLIAVLLIGCSSAYSYEANVAQYHYGSGTYKGDAIASALSKVNYGNTIKKVEINGSSTKRYVPGVGYIQTHGSYKCRIISGKVLKIN